MTTLADARRAPSTSSSKPDLPTAAIIIPVLNEAVHIGALLNQLLGDAPSALVEVLVADGGSVDDTRRIVAERADSDRRVRLLDNPQRLQAAGCNLAALAARADVKVIVRIDAHSAYPEHYVSRLLEAIADTGADSVVVRLRSEGGGCFQRAVAAAGNTRLGAGAARHRVGARDAWVDHGHHAAVLRERFLALGGYDETFAANEDAEFDARLIQAGGRIWFASDLEVTYWPRGTPWALARQYFRYGIGRARNSRKTRSRLRPRQLLPPVILLGCAGCLLLAFVNPVFLAAPLAYVTICSAYGAALALVQRRLCVALSGVCAIIMHLSWGAGFLSAWLRPSRPGANVLAASPLAP